MLILPIVKSISNAYIALNMFIALAQCAHVPSLSGCLVQVLRLWIISFLTGGDTKLRQLPGDNWGGASDQGNGFVSLIARIIVFWKISH